MLMLKNKATLLKQIKDSKVPADVHEILIHNPKIDKLAQHKLGLMYDKQEQKYDCLKDLSDLSISVPYSFVCVKNDLSLLVRDY